MHMCKLRFWNISRDIRCFTSVGMPMLPFRFAFFCEAIVPSSRGNAHIEGELYFISASWSSRKDDRTRVALETLARIAS